MPEIKNTRMNKMLMYAFLVIGAGLVATSAFYNSSVLAVFGVTVAFWSAIFAYITPSTHVPLSLLETLVDKGSNIERILEEQKLSEKGIYLPPKNLGNIESSLLFVPEKSNVALPSVEQTSGNLSLQGTGVLLTPPGQSLSQLFERKLQISFTKIDFPQLKVLLPKLLVEDIGIVSSAQIELDGNTVSVELKDNILSRVCEQTNDLPRTHNQVGCLLSSAIACVIAKVAGKPVVLSKEELNTLTQQTNIEYTIMKG